MKRSPKFRIDITVPFESYNNRKLDRKAMNAIKRWIGSIIKEIGGGDGKIPLYIQKDDSGAVIEDLTDNLQFKIDRLSPGKDW